MPPRTLLPALAIAGVAAWSGCDDPGPTAPAPPVETSTPTPPPAATGASGAAPVAAAPRDVPASGPRIEFEARVHDFGTISDIAAQDYSFAFRNVGDAPLVIEAVKPNCGCTVTTLAKDTFAPGESAAIDVRFEPKGHGRQSKHIRVVSNSIDAEVTTLGISANIVPIAWPEPDRYLRLGRQWYGRAFETTFEVHSLDPDLEVLRVRGSSPHFRPVLLPAVPGEPRKVSVTIPASAPWGPIGGRILVDVHARPFPGEPPVQHEVEVNVNAQMYDAVTISENPIIVGGVEPGAEFVRKTVIRHVDGDLFTITDARLDATQMTDVQLRVTPQGGSTPAAAWDVEVFGATGNSTGLIRGRVVLQTDLPGVEREMQMQYLGSVKAKD